MSQVSQSAVRSATQLFNAVTTVADATSNAVKAVGNAFEVANVHSSEWLETTKLTSKLNSVNRREVAVDEVANSISTRTIEREKQLAQNPALRIAYDAAVFKLNAVLDAQ